VVKNFRAGHVIIASAIIWAAVIISSALKLKGTPFRETVGLSLTIGVIAHLLFVWIPLGAGSRKRKETDAKEQ